MQPLHLSLAFSQCGLGRGMRQLLHASGGQRLCQLAIQGCPLFVLFLQLPLQALNCCNLCCGTCQRTRRAWKLDHISVGICDVFQGPALRPRQLSGWLCLGIHFGSWHVLITRHRALLIDSDSLTRVLRMVCVMLRRGFQILVVLFVISSGVGCRGVSLRGRVLLKRLFVGVRLFLVWGPLAGVLRLAFAQLSALELLTEPPQLSHVVV